jgi:purine nucleosidase
MTIPLIIDCDPGVDDAIALLLAFASPELNILGITTVAGNVPLHLTQANARKICDLAGRSPGVYAGCPRPLLRPLETAEYVHGATGLQGATLSEPQLPLATSTRR